MIEVISVSTVVGLLPLVANVVVIVVAEIVEVVIITKAIVLMKMIIIIIIVTDPKRLEYRPNSTILHRFRLWHVSLNLDADAVIQTLLFNNSTTSFTI